MILNTRRPRLTAMFALAAIGEAMQAGCASPTGGPYASPAQSTRDPLEAQRLTLQAAQDLEQHPHSPEALSRAQRLLREALTADLYHGPAHNDLGVVYLAQDRLYDAAGEFEWARKLMPGHPDPRRNLALTLERAGRTQEAISTYRTALEVYPDHLPTIQALTRLQIRSGRADGTTREMLEQVALRGDSQQWRDWARENAAHLAR